MFPSTTMQVGGQRLPETGVLLARMSVQPTVARAFRYNALIQALKIAGLYTNTKIKGLYIHAAHDAQAARLNLIENAANLSVTGAMTFTTDRGYAGDGGTAELTATGFASGASHCSGVWVNSYNSSSGYLNAGGGNGYVRTTTAGIFGRWGAIGDSGVSATGVAHGVMSTNDPATQLRFYKNGALVANSPKTPVALSGGTIHLCLGYSARQAASHWGFDLTVAEIAALNAALSAFLTPIGAA